MADCEVLIVGAGVAGCAAALGLLQAGVRRVLLVERAPDSAARAVGESLTPDVIPALRALGVLPPAGAALPAWCWPYHANLSAWGSAQLSRHAFSARALAWRQTDAQGGAPHGLHVARAAMNTALRAQAQAAGAQLLQAAHVTGLQAPGAPGQPWRVQVADVNGLQEIQAAFLLDAGGRRAPLVRHLGLQPQRLDNLVARVWRLDCAHDLDGCSLVESRPEGWWYAAPQAEGGCIAMLMSDADLMESIDVPQAWRATRHLARLLPAVPVAGDTMTVAAHSAFLPHSCGPGWAALGDAAMAFDPLTSSGVAAALADARRMTPAILSWLAQDFHQALQIQQRCAQQLRAELQRYVAGLRRQYGAERRFAGAPFWARRHLSAAQAA
ncbi:FAD-dependent monooxygenase [Massilia sp. W12]|uniref:NAD(P)/FAD-dependent oxidoreductase n=1 Tax=Massilia sp. W12 TaxID=3126507 RepID=UPI0030D302E2